MDSIPLAERIVRFIRQVDNFLSYDFAEQVVLKTGAPNDEIEAAHERRMDARDAMRDDGRQLAQELVSAGYDPETVLRLLYCIDRNGGGARTVKRRWPQAKVTLQTLVLQLQKGRSELSNTKPAERIGTKSRTRRAGRRRLEDSNPIKCQVYERIVQAHQPGKQYLDTIARLKTDKQFLEQVREAHLRLNAELVRKALAFFDRRKRGAIVANQ